MRKEITISGRKLMVSDEGEVWRLSFIGKNGKRLPTKKLTPTEQRGYLGITIMGLHGKTVRKSVHRLVAQAFIEGFSDKLWVDHINGISSDNRLSNLRLVTPQGNHRGRYRKIAGASSRYRGVTWESSRNRWKAAICINDVRINLGRYRSEHKAALAYDRAASRAGFYPEALNFPPAI